jgi:hypothetical protein
MAKSKMLLKIDLLASHEICVDNLSALSLQDLMKKRGYLGPSRWFQVSVSGISNKIEINCHLPFTLPPNEEDRDDIGKFLVDF